MDEKISEEFGDKNSPDYGLLLERMTGTDSPLDSDEMWEAVTDQMDVAEVYEAIFNDTDLALPSAEDLLDEWDGYLWDVGFYTQHRREDVVERFHHEILIGMNLDDDTAVSEAWNNWTDMLCKDKEITGWQYQNWDGWDEVKDLDTSMVSVIRRVVER